MGSNSFAIVTLGCKVNQYESQVLREKLWRAGMNETNLLDSPDIFLLNTCAVTAKSGAESRKWINRVRRESPRATIVAVGCCVDIEPEAVAGADVVVPQAKKHALVEAAGGGPEELVKVLAGVSDGNRKSNMDLEIHGFAGHTRAFLKIQDGCSSGCSYCAVPIARGRSVSRAVEVVLDVVIEEDRDDYSLGLTARYVWARVKGSFTRGTRLRGTAAGHDGKYINIERTDILSLRDKCQSPDYMEVCDE